MNTHGGLTGPTSDKNYYASKLDVPSAASLWSTAGWLWRAAEDDAKAKAAVVAAAATAPNVVPDASSTARAADVAAPSTQAHTHTLSTEAYVASVSAAMRTFMRQKTLWNRATTKNALLASVGAGTGRMVLLLGGKDVGKSLLLKSIVSELNAGGAHVAVVVNMRDGLPLGPAIIRAVERSASVPSSDGAAFFALFKKALRAGVEKLVEKDESVDGVLTVAKKTGIVATAPVNPTVFDVLDAFVTTCERVNNSLLTGADVKGKFPVLIVDEANLALPSKDAEATIAVLHKLTTLTKQESRLSVVLASSEHAEPFRYADLPFNMASTTVVVAGEVPPADMRALLTTQWRCGPHLAEALLSAYGGHILRASIAVGMLAADGDAFAAGSALAAPQGMDACFDALDTGKGVVDAKGTTVDIDGTRLEDALRALAVDGYFPLLKLADPLARLLSFHNVAGVVSREAGGRGVPGVLRPAAWSEHLEIAWLLIPTSQSARLQLALKLTGLDIQRGRSRKPMTPM